MEDPINILIVDDEPKNLTVLETVLDDPGYRLVRRVVRLTRRTPRRVSSAAKRRLTTAVDRPSSRAAADRLPAVTTRTKIVISCRLSDILLR